MKYRNKILHDLYLFFFFFLLLKKKHEISGVAVSTNYCLNLPGNQFRC